MQICHLLVTCHHNVSHKQQPRDMLNGSPSGYLEDHPYQPRATPDLVSCWRARDQCSQVAPRQVNQATVNGRVVPVIFLRFHLQDFPMRSTQPQPHTHEHHYVIARLMRDTTTRYDRKGDEWVQRGFDSFLETLSLRDTYGR